jgi:predicted nucleic acid-binding protein
MEQKYLMDSNAVIDFLTASYSQNGMRFMNQVVNDTVNISVISKIEVLGFNAPANELKKLTHFVSLATILELGDEVVEKTIDLRKQYQIKLPDAVIASTALEHKLILITNNVKDFKNIKGLKLANPNDY